MVRWRDVRRNMWMSGALAAPSALASPLFVPEYWRSARVAEFICGPEDVAFSFGAGVLAWFAAHRMAGTSPSLRPHLRTFLRRSAGFLLAAFLAFRLLRGQGAGIMVASATTLGGVAVGLLALRPCRWRLALAGALGHGLLYTVCASVVFAAFAAAASNRVL
jgi:hypothetical protein